GAFSVYLLNSDGSTLGSSFATNQGTVIGKTLASTGTYQVVVFPYNGVTGSATISLTSQTTNSTINFNTPVTQTISVPSGIGLSFSGTAGQVVSAEVAGFAGGY